VYRDLLATTGATAPRYRGTWTVPGRGTCLVVDALTTAATLRRHPPDRMLDAAAWIGRFHRQATRELGRPELGFLARYDREHIWSWMSRAQRQATEHGLSLPWLTDLAGRFEGMVTELTSDPPAVIHGEFYPLNILASDAHIHPIDWESAGIGPGEIDLASLVMGWPDPIAAKCRSSYAQSRWPEGVPPGFAARLQAATLYLCLRMLGDNQRPSAPAGGLPFFDYLHRTAVTCGLLPANG
jgi:aminoglycoside phosphotransferase (APT) family kinase protein